MASLQQWGISSPNVNGFRATPASGRCCSVTKNTAVNHNPMQNTQSWLRCSVQVREEAIARDSDEAPAKPHPEKQFTCSGPAICQCPHTSHMARRLFPSTPCMLALVMRVVSLLPACHAGAGPRNGVLKVTRTALRDWQIVTPRGTRWNT